MSVYWALRNEKMALCARKIKFSHENYIDTGFGLKCFKDLGQRQNIPDYGDKIKMYNKFIKTENSKFVNHASEVTIKRNRETSTGYTKCASLA